MKEQPKTISVCILECLLMPQGEVICKGKTIGWFKDLKENLQLKPGHNQESAETKDEEEEV